jgi:hypothetical protein
MPLDDQIDQRSQLIGQIWDALQPQFTPPTVSEGLAPGFVRGPNGLTYNDQSPDTVLPGGIPAWSTGPVQQSPLLPLIEKYESGGRNILQQQVDPSISSASGYYQITDSTWKDIAPKVGIDVGQFPTAMSAPREVQTAVASKLLEERGVAPWAPYNPRLASALQGTPYGTGMQGGQASQFQPFQPVTVARSDQTSPGNVTINAPSVQAPQDAGRNPLASMMLMQVLQAQMAGTHKFTPVNYDPWKVAGQQSPFEGAM